MGMWIKRKLKVSIQVTIRKGLCILLGCLLWLNGWGQELAISSINKEYLDLENASEFIAGPKGKFYALFKHNEELHIALFHIDSLTGVFPEQIEYKLEKVLSINKLLLKEGFYEGKFICTSSDGRYIGIAVGLRSTKLAKIYLIDFLNSSIRFSKILNANWIGSSGSFINDQFVYFAVREFYIPIIDIYWRKPKIQGGIFNNLNLSFSHLNSEIYTEAKNYFNIDSPSKSDKDIKLLLANTVLRHKNDSLKIIGESGSTLGVFYCKNFDLSRRAGFTNVKIYSSIGDEKPNIVSIYDFNNKIIEKEYEKRNFGFLLNDSMLIYNIYNSNISGWLFYLLNINTKKSEKVFLKKTNSNRLFSAFQHPNSFYLLKNQDSFFYDFNLRKFQKLKNEKIPRDQLIHPLRISDNFPFSVNHKIKGNQRIYTFKIGDFRWIGYDSLYVSQFFPGGSRFTAEVSRDEKFLYYYDQIHLLKFRKRDGFFNKTNFDQRYRNVRDIKLSEDQKTLALNTGYSSLTLLNTLKGKKYLTVHLDTTSMDWILYTPSGYYDCSPGGEKLIGWSVSRGADSLPAYYPASRFRERFYRPDVVDSVIKYCSEEIALKKLGLLGGKKVQKAMVKRGHRKKLGSKMKTRLFWGEKYSDAGHPINPIFPEGTHRLF